MLTVSWNPLDVVNCREIESFATVAMFAYLYPRSTWREFGFRGRISQDEGDERGGAVAKIVSETSPADFDTDLRPVPPGICWLLRGQRAAQGPIRGPRAFGRPYRECRANYEADAEESCRGKRSSDRQYPTANTRENHNVPHN